MGHVRLFKQSIFVPLLMPPRLRDYPQNVPQFQLWHGGSTLIRLPRQEGSNFTKVERLDFGCFIYSSMITSSVVHLNKIGDPAIAPSCNSQHTTITSLLFLSPLVTCLDCRSIWGGALPRRFYCTDILQYLLKWTSKLTDPTKSAKTHNKVTRNAVVDCRGLLCTVHDISSEMREGHVGDDRGRVGDAESTSG